MQTQTAVASHTKTEQVKFNPELNYYEAIKKGFYHGETLRAEGSQSRESPLLNQSSQSSGPEEPSLTVEGAFHGRILGLAQLHDPNGQYKAKPGQSGFPQHGGTRGCVIGCLVQLPPAPRAALPQLLVSGGILPWVGSELLYSFCLFPPILVPSFPAQAEKGVQ